MFLETSVTCLETNTVSKSLKTITCTHTCNNIPEFIFSQSYTYTGKSAALLRVKLSRPIHLKVQSISCDCYYLYDFHILGLCKKKNLMGTQIAVGQLSAAVCVLYLVYQQTI
jgi:hypothetical protein